MTELPASPSSSQTRVWSWPGLHRSLLAALDLALPVTCGACAAPGQRWCPSCRVGVQTASPVFGVIAAQAAPHRPTTWAARDYDGALAEALVAYKDGDRRDLGRELSAQLARSLRIAVEAFADQERPVAIVPVPSSAAARRRRGDAPLEPLARAALRAVDAQLGPGSLWWAPVLRVRRRVADQSHLDARSRVENVAGAFEARTDPRSRRHLHRLTGHACVVVDDVTTTGSSLAEAARALRAAGAATVHGAVVAATRRRAPEVQPALPPHRSVV